MPTGFWITISEDGVEKSYPTHCTNSDYTQDCTVSDDGHTITMNANCRLELLETKKDGDWAVFDLLDKTLAYDINLGNVKKGHNFAFYSCQLTKGQEYKDAQSWDSRTELDFMEANRTAWHTTYHKRYDKGGGCIMGLGGGIRSFKSDTGKSPDDLFGPGQYIDTNRPFHVEHTHTREKACLEITQDDKKIWDEAGGTYWAQLLPEFEGRRHTPRHQFVGSRLGNVVARRSAPFLR